MKIINVSTVTITTITVAYTNADGKYATADVEVLSSSNQICGMKSSSGAEIPAADKASLVEFLKGAGFGV